MNYGKPVEFRVLCSGTRHTIRWEREKLQLLDHPHLHRELVMAPFGAPCRCVQILLTWRQPLMQVQQLPKPLQPIYYEFCRRKRDARRKAHLNAVDQLSEPIPFIDRIRRRTGATIAALIITNRGYRHHQNTTVDVMCNYSPATTFVNTAISSSFKDYGRARHRAAIGVTHKVWVATTWLTQVLKPGYAVIDGLVTLEIIRRQNGRYYRVAIVQSRGYSLTTKTIRMNI